MKCNVGIFLNTGCDCIACLKMSFVMCAVKKN